MIFLFSRVEILVIFSVDLFLPPSPGNQPWLLPCRLFSWLHVTRISLGWLLCARVGLGKGLERSRLIISILWILQNCPSVVWHCLNIQLLCQNSYFPFFSFLIPAFSLLSRISPERKDSLISFLCKFLLTVMKDLLFQQKPPKEKNPNWKPIGPS